MSHITITQASALTLPALKRLFARAVETNFSYFPQAVRRQVIRDHSLRKLIYGTLDPRRIILTAHHGKTLIGYAIGAAPAVGPAQLYWLYVEPEHRGNQVGVQLLSQMLQLLRHKGAASVSIATHDHRSYYERQGFVFYDNTVVNDVDMDILIFKYQD